MADQSSNTEQIVVEESEVYTIEDYLLGVTPLATEERIKMLMTRKGVEFGTEVADMEQKTIDLLSADVLYWSAKTSPSTAGGKEEQVGNWKTKKSGNTLTNSDKASMIRMAKALYAQWNEPWIWGGVRICINKGMSI